jgi:hypothetical protein
MADANTNENLLQQLLAIFGNEGAAIPQKLIDLIRGSQPEEVHARVASYIKVNESSLSPGVCSAVATMLKNDKATTASSSSSDVLSGAVAGTSGFSNNAQPKKSNEVDMQKAVDTAKGILGASDFSPTSELEPMASVTEVEIDLHKEDRVPSNPIGGIPSPDEGVLTIPENPVPITGITPKATADPAATRQGQINDILGQLRGSSLSDDQKTAALQNAQANMGLSEQENKLLGDTWYVSLSPQRQSDVDKFFAAVGKPSPSASLVSGAAGFGGADSSSSVDADAVRRNADAMVAAMPELGGKSANGYGSTPVIPSLKKPASSAAPAGNASSGSTYVDSLIVTAPSVPKNRISQ